MPRFKYRAVTQNGTLTEGEIDAPSCDVVIARIQDSGRIPLHAEQVVDLNGTGSYLQHILHRRNRITREDIAYLTRELATLLQAGLPLDRALLLLQGLAGKPAVKQLIRSVHARIQAGDRFSHALEEHCHVFSRLYLNTVRAGEAGGTLDLVLQRLADYLDRSAEIRTTVVSAMIYPAILMMVALISIFALLIFVVPRFETMFADMDAVLPLSTRLVFGAAETLQRYGIFFLIITVIGIWAGRRWLCQHGNRLRRDAWLLRSPLLGDLITKVETGRFSRTLAALIGNGVPLLTAVGIAREVLMNQVLVEDLATIESALEQGRGMAQPLREHSHFPPLAIQLVQVGEESGHLETMLLRMADIYERESDTAIKRTLTIIEPVLILGMGTLVAVIILSILVAILGLNELVA